jgi:hypothetical protein
MASAPMAQPFAQRKVRLESLSVLGKVRLESPTYYMSVFSTRLTASST